jgi:hypothetical protein
MDKAHINSIMPKHKASFIRRDFNVIILLCFFIFNLYASFSVIYALKRLCRKGVTAHARKNFVVKHILYVVVILISWLILLLNNFESLYNFTKYTKDTNFYGKTNSLNFVSYLFMFGNGILLATVRLQEPFYYFAIKE